MYNETVVVWLETARMNRLAATAAFVELLRHQLNHMIDGGFSLGSWYFIANFVMSPVVRNGYWSQMRDSAAKVGAGWSWWKALVIGRERGAG